MGFEIERVPGIHGISSDVMSDAFNFARENGGMNMDVANSQLLAETMNEKYGFAPGDTDAPWGTDASGFTTFDGDRVFGMSGEEFADLHTSVDTDSIKNSGTLQKEFGATRKQVEDARKRVDESTQRLNDRMDAEPGLPKGADTSWEDFKKANVPWIRDLLIKAAEVGLAFGLLDAIASAQSGCYAKTTSKSQLLTQNKDDCGCAAQISACPALCDDMLQAPVFGDVCCQNSCVKGTPQSRCTLSTVQGETTQTGGRCDYCNCVTADGTDVQLKWVQRTWKDVFSDVASSVGYYVEKTADAGLDIVKTAANLFSQWWLWLLIVLGVGVVVTIIIVAAKYGGKKKEAPRPPAGMPLPQ